MEIRKRNTIQRRIVEEAVVATNSHATPEEIYAYVSVDHPNVSKATVYRNLKELSESGKITRIPTPNGADHYDHINYPHYHVRCEKCGKVFDVDMPYMDHLVDNISNKHGFKINGYELVFSGVCPECQANKID